MAQVTITADDLRARIDNGTPPVLLDVRWKLGDADGHQHYLDGHIPGAVYVDLDTDLAAPASPAAGRHPLPDIETFQETVRRWGIDDGSAVVVYDDNGSQSAARLWWLLRWAGLSDVVLLDGGLRTWRDAGYEFVDGAQTAGSIGTVTLSPSNAPTVDIDGVAKVAGVLLDARAGERYRGEREPIDARAGHIPGALSAPTADNIDETGQFLPPDQLRSRFAELGVTPATNTTVYCGSGVTAAHQIAALAIAGIDASLYPGSWSQWSSDPDREVATGPSPR